jgi:Uncharacterised protein family (UPF0158)
MNIKLAELIDAMDFVSVATFENKAYLHKATGKIYWQSEEDFGFEALPDDIGNENYLEIPSNYDFGLGKPLVMKFVYEFLPNSASEVQAIFRKQGAYARYKSLLDNHDLLDQWHQYHNNAQARAIREWCEENGVELDG